MTMTKQEAADSVASHDLFGIWDTRGDCWLGNEDGPLVYPVKILAQVAATILTERFGYYILPKPFTGYDQLKDVVTPRLTAIEAIKRIEARIPNAYSAETAQENCDEREAEATDGD